MGNGRYECGVGRDVRVSWDQGAGHMPNRIVNLARFE
jgi:hypothetical protein